MAVLRNEQDGIITLSSNDTFSRERMPVESVILTGPEKGKFDFTLGNAELTITTGSAFLTQQLDVNRTLNRIGLKSGPRDARMYVLLKQG